MDKIITDQSQRRCFLFLSAALRLSGVVRG